MSAQLPNQSEIQSRTYSLDDSLEFARISGDSNPMHVDPLEARRTAFGRPVIHGIQLVLDGLQLLSQHVGNMRLVALKGTFLKAVLIGDAVTFRLAEKAPDRYRITINSDRLAAFVDITLLRGAQQDVAVDIVSAGVQASVVSLLNRSFAQVAQAEGRIPVVYDRSAFRQRFPAVFRCLPCCQIADIVVSSTLVGMECPGRHSIYSRFHFRFCESPPAAQNRWMEYRTTGSDQRFRTVTLSVTTGVCEGEVVAFVRPEPTQQISPAAAQSLVGSEEFHGIQALVVGGSRGLGETTCKLLAAGGAQVTLTYTRGLAEAEQIQHQMKTVDGTVQIAQLDILDVENSELSFPSGAELSLFYFATPAITAGEGAFSAARFDNFCQFYVSGLNRLVQRLTVAGYRIRHLLSPSSIYVETLPRGMAEYSAAKAAAEILCQQFQQQGIRVYCPRWPRMQTDQTASVVPETYADTATVVLNSIRELLDQ